MSGTKQRKTWHRPRNVVLALVAAVLVFFGWAFLEVWQVYTAEPNPTVDYRAKLRALAEDHAGVSSDEADEAWSKLVETLGLAESVYEQARVDRKSADFEARDEFDDGSVEYVRVVVGRVFAEDIDRERRALELLRDRGVFRALDALSSGPVGLLDPKGQEGLMMQDFLPELGKCRDLSRARAASMRLAVTDGDMDEVVRAFRDILAVARTMSHQPYSVSYLVATSIEAMALDELRYELMEATFDFDVAQKLLSVFQEQLPLAPAEVYLENERLQYCDFVQTIYTDDGDGNGYLMAGGDLSSVDPSIGYLSPSLIAAFNARFFMPSRSEETEVFGDLIDLFAAMLDQLPAARATSVRDARVFAANLPDQYTFPKLLASPIDKTLRHSSVMVTLAEGTRVMVALEAFFAQHGYWPPSLIALVPEILPQPPVDPLHGGPFGYRLVDDDRFGRPYILYSFGLDATDDGGIEFNSGTNDVYRGIQPLTDYNLTGIDYVINKPRPLEW